MTKHNQDSFGNQELDALRQGYKREVMIQTARDTLSQIYPPGAGYIGAIMDSLYTGEPISPMDRERCIISLLATAQGQMPLAVHIYWGMMAGLSLDEVAHTFLLTGAYCGVDKYTTGLLTLQKVIGALKELSAKGDVESQTVLGRFIEIF